MAAGPLLFANNATTTLAGPLSTTSTTCNVAAGSGALFPQPGVGQSFKLTFIDAATKTDTEIVLVTAVSTDTFTIARAQEGTTALNWNAGDIAANLLTAGTFTGLAQTANLPTSFVSGTDSGSNANAVVVATTNPAVSAPSVGQLFLITKSNNGNTGPTTFQISSGTAYAVVYKDGSALNPGDWPGSTAALLYFTGGVMQYVANAGNIGVKTYFGRDTGTADAMQVVTTPAVPAFADNVDVEFVKGPSPNVTTTPTLVVNQGANALAATTIVRFDGTAIQPGDLPGNGLVCLKADASLGAYRLRNPIAPTQVKEIKQNPVIWVRTDGNDTNMGTGNSPTLAKATISGAIAQAGLYDFSTTALTINLGISGTYAMPALFPRLSGQLNINGASGVSGVVCQGSVVIGGGNLVVVSNLTLQTSAGGTCLSATTGGVIYIGAGVTLQNATGSSAGAFMFAGGGGSLTLENDVTLLGNMSNMFYVGTGFIQVASGVNINLNNNVFSNAVILGDSNGDVGFVGKANFVGSATGPAYRLTFGSNVRLNGTVLPGSAGSADATSAIG